MARSVWKSTRLYELDGRYIASGKVTGLLHKATKNLGTCMGGCSSDVLPGQRYVQILIFGADPVHAWCLATPDPILGTKVIPRSRSMLTEGRVYCSRFLDKDLSEMHDRDCSGCKSRWRHRKKVVTK